MAYSPSLGRWMQEDPAGYVDGANLYESYEGSPVDNVDPLGLRAMTPYESAIDEKLHGLSVAARNMNNNPKNDAFSKQVDAFREDLAAAIKAVPEGQANPSGLAITLSALHLWFTDPGDQWGEGVIDSKDYQSSCPGYAKVPASQYKCNICVAEAIWQALGLFMPSISSAEEKGKWYPPQARQWSDTKHAILHFPVVNDAPQMGDIVAIGGHVGIHLGRGIYISARDNDEGVVTLAGCQRKKGIQIKELPEKVDATRRYTPNKQ